MGYMESCEYPVYLKSQKKKQKKKNAEINKEILNAEKEKEKKRYFCPCYIAKSL